jgi:EAL domain-containing protein (putative c-di-GMP-specific phosphodiesterase class I)/FixJ family two-component response regulator
MDRTIARHAYVLDDEPDVGTLVCHLLTANGFTSQQFSNRAAFMVGLRASLPELIVLDLALGQTDAVEIIRQLKSVGYGGKLLLMSGRCESSLAEISGIGKFHGLAMLPPLRKPFGAAELGDRLSAAPEEPKTPAREATGNAGSTTADLIGALRNGWLELWYQPKIDLKSLQACGAEALVRIRHPKRGIIYPSGFLPRPGDPKYWALTRFVIQRAMADWTYLAERDVLLKLAVNVPVSVLRTTGFMPFVRRSLPTDARFPGLVLEVTEDEAIREPEWMQELAVQLKLYGISLSMDDFGSGYSSLSRLRDLPCAEVKLDRTFVSSCSSDRRKRMLCSAAIELAHGFGATVCAEGVENPQDLHTLTELGCDTAQGFLFSEPIDREALLAHLSGAPGGAWVRAS